MKKNRVLFILVSSIFVISALYVVDRVLLFSYDAKVLSKIILFALFPMLYIIKTKDNFFLNSILNKFKSKDRGRDLSQKGLSHGRLSAILGVAVFLAVVGCYYLMKNSINTEIVRNEFEVKYKINRDNLIFYGLYLSFFNSLMEEFFFRGYLFLTLRKMISRKWSYTISSALFTVYHLANFQSWFSIGLFLLVVFGLFLGGHIFNYLDESEDTFLNSWFVHICADLGIVFAGCEIFGIFVS